VSNRKRRTETTLSKTHLQVVREREENTPIYHQLLREFDGLPERRVTVALPSQRW
jgi:hypothetical protein